MPSPKDSGQGVRSLPLPASGVSRFALAGGCTRLPLSSHSLLLCVFPLQPVSSVRTLSFRAYSDPESSHLEIFNLIPSVKDHQ